METSWRLRSAAMFPALIPVRSIDPSMLLAIDGRAERLRQVVQDTDEVRLLHRYRQEATEAVQVLASYFRRDEIDALIRPAAFWHLMAIGAVVGGLRAIATDAINTAVDGLVALRTELQAFEISWQHDIPLVPDTNTWIHHVAGRPMADIDWGGLAGLSALAGVRVVVLEVVLDELDRLKDRGQGPARTHSRSVLRELTELVGADPATRREFGQESGSTVEVLFDPPTRRRMERADLEILDRVAALESLAGTPVRLLTRDTAMMMRARARRLAVYLVEDHDPKGQARS